MNEYTTKQGAGPRKTNQKQQLLTHTHTHTKTNCWTVKTQTQLARVTFESSDASAHQRVCSSKDGRPLTAGCCFFFAANLKLTFSSFSQVEARRIIYSNWKNKTNFAHVNMWFATLFSATLLDSLGPSRLAAASSREREVLAIIED